MNLAPDGVGWGASTTHTYRLAPLLGDEPLVLHVTLVSQNHLLHVLVGVLPADGRSGAGQLGTAVGNSTRSFASPC